MADDLPGTPDSEDTTPRPTTLPPTQSLRQAGQHHVVKKALSFKTPGLEAQALTSTDEESTTAELPDEEEDMEGRESRRTAFADKKLSMAASTFFDSAADFMRNSLVTEEPSRPRQSNMFGDIIQMKEDAKNKMKYNVKDLYHSSGFWQALTRTRAFENVTIAVISFNALWMAFETDSNTAETLVDADAIFLIAENVFCLFFSVELFARFMSFRKKTSALQDAWFVFDAALVFMLIMETWILTFVLLGTNSHANFGNVSIFKLFRLTRLSRMARMLRSMPELLILIQGMCAAMRSVAFVLLLLLIFNYVFSIGFVQLLRGTDAGDRYFHNIPGSMYTLLVSGTFTDNLSIVAEDIGRDSMFCAVLFFVFVGVAALTVLNMLIGVLCEVVTAVADVERENMSLDYFVSRFEKIWHRLDEDGSGLLTPTEFAKIMHDDEVWETLQSINIDPVVVLKLSDQIFKKEGEDDEEVDEADQCLTLTEFMAAILPYRASNTATVKDMIELRSWIEENFREQRKEIRKSTVRTSSFLMQSGNDDHDIYERTSRNMSSERVW